MAVPKSRPLSEAKPTSSGHSQSDENGPQQKSIILQIGAQRSLSRSSRVVPSDGARVLLLKIDVDPSCNVREGGVYSSSVSCRC